MTTPQKEGYAMDSPYAWAGIGGLITWGLTALGGASVFIVKSKHPTLLNACLGFAAGIMMAGAYFSLLAPALEMNAGVLPVVIGFLLGGGFLLVAERLLHRLLSQQERMPHRTALLVFAVTLHNIPEGLAIGVAFSMAAQNPELLGVALALCLGIGLQDIPEGAAVSMPLLRDGFSRRKAFLIGQLSGIVEPIAAVVGVLLTAWVQALLPWALSFAAGAMYLVVIRELVPEAQKDNSMMAAIAGLCGFALMMFLDCTL